MQIRGTAKINFLDLEMPKKTAAKIIGKKRIKVTKSKGCLLIIALNNFTKNIEMAANQEPKNMPAVGPKNSRGVKLCFEPRIGDMKIWDTANPKIIKMAINNTFFTIFC